MKKIILLTCLCFSLNIQAQQTKSTTPSKLQIELNGTKDVAVILKLANKAMANKNYKLLQLAMEKAVRIKPNNPTLDYKLAEAYALNNNKSGAFNALIELQKQGIYFDIEKNDNFANINTFPVFGYIKDNMQTNREHFGEGEESFSLDKSFTGLLFESLALDYKGQAFLMGSLRDGSVIKILNSGEIKTHIKGSNGGKYGPWATVDLAVDNENDVLWVASAAVTQFGRFTKETIGLAGIFKYKLSTGKLIDSFLLPENQRPMMINSIHLTKQGDLFLLDSQKSLVLKLAKGSDVFTVVFSNKEFKNLRSITSDDTGTIVYLSDAEEGILIVDLVYEKIATIKSSPALNLIGISDLDFDDNGLIIIQNGFSPERVMRLILNPDKATLKTFIPIESNHPKFNYPTKGTVVDGGYYYIANSQSSKANSFGGLSKGKQWSNLSIISSDKHYKEKSALEYQEKMAEIRDRVGSK